MNPAARYTHTRTALVLGTDRAHPKRATDPDANKSFRIPRRESAGKCLSLVEIGTTLHDLLLKVWPTGHDYLKHDYASFALTKSKFCTTLSSTRSNKGDSKRAGATG